MKSQIGLIPCSYVLDANVFADFWDASNVYRPYPIDIPGNFQTWQTIEELVKDGKAASPEDVKEQLLKADLPDLKIWINQHAFMFLPLDGIPGLEDNLKAVIAAYPNYSNPKADPADAVIIAMAMSFGATVVTQERPQTSEGVLPKIPNVCNKLNVKCLSLNDFLREASPK